MKRKLIYIFSCWLSSIILFVACDDMEDKPFTSGIIGDPTETGTAELYVLCEGLFNQNNSSLARFSFGNQQMVRDYFKAVNRRGLGDTANDMAIYGSKIYVIVNISSTVEVIDFRTGSSLKQIQMLAENGSSRQPRYIAFHKEKAYVCSYDGTVARIDTTSPIHRSYHISGTQSRRYLCTKRKVIYFQFRRIGLFIRTGGRQHGICCRYCHI